MQSITITIVILLLAVAGISAFLKPIQVERIKRIIRHPDTPMYIQVQTRMILAKHYHPWLKKQIHQFIINYRTRITKPHELEGSAMLEYMKAIEKYNGSVEFSLYAKKYVFGGLYKCLVYNPVSIMDIRNIARLPSKLLNNKNINTIHKKVAEMEESYRKIFYLRYDFMTLSKKHSVSKICEIMGFSAETYRKKMNQILEHIRRQE
jgi:DNA-directed RNA polymerase specialized sigma subunit